MLSSYNWTGLAARVALVSVGCLAVTSRLRAGKVRRLNSTELKKEVPT